MTPLLQIYEGQAAMTEQQFVASQHAAPVLIHRLRTEDSQALSFKTTYSPPTSRVETVKLGKALDALKAFDAGVKDLDSLVVFAVTKRPGGAFSDRITVGRTRTMDVFLPFPSISKLHARFNIVEGGTRHTLTDCGSTNGTFVSGKKLAQDQPIELLSGALIQFGQTQHLFFTPSSLYRLLRGG